MTIKQAVLNFQNFIHQAIKANGINGKNAIIRSQRPIDNIHQAVKYSFLKVGIQEDQIIPPLGHSKPELKVAGLLKRKDQDVCVVPIYDGIEEVLADGLLDGELCPYGERFLQETIMVNVRSQLSSINKNFDTLYERTALEAMNVHARTPSTVMGEVYMIAALEYGNDANKNQQLGFNKPSPSSNYSGGLLSAQRS